MSRSQPRSRVDSVAIPIISILRGIIALVALAIVAAVIAIIWAHRDDLFGHSAIERHIDPNAYQAVFLTTSQVYFGKLRIDGDVYVLSDVFYVNQPEQGSGQLVKRGSEIHGPRDPMVIPARQVLQVENLREDSQVVQAIRLIQSGQAPAAPASGPATPRPSPTR